VANSDLAGFTERERLLIASLCRYHRKSLPNTVHGAYQALGPEERRTLLLAIPLLRLADNLGHGEEQRVSAVECHLRNGEVVLEVRARGDIDLEQWGAERAGEAFRQFYGRDIRVARVD
ncbi:MAG TPA: hypothetical protein VMU19_02785, partial [Bryobacteraceae bacterium]|nr:hypothetical protein [Bryobacteraceae bacterium]